MSILKIPSRVHEDGEKVVDYVNNLKFDEENNSGHKGLK